MWTVITVALAIIAVLFGLTELLRRCWLYFMRPKDDPPGIMLIFLKEDIAVEQLRYAAEYLSWEGEKSFFAVAAIDTGLSEKTKSEVLKIVNSRYDMMFGEKDLVNFIKDIKG